MRSVVRAWSTFLVLAAATCARGQTPGNPAASPLDAATASRADAPVTAVPVADSTVSRVSRMLLGSFESAPVGDAPALRFNSAPLTVAGLDNAIYFEISRVDSPGEPFRQGVFHVFRFKDEYRLRVFDFAVAPGFKDSIVALWAAPENLPRLTSESLVPNMDLVLDESGGMIRAATRNAVPTMRDGAVEVQSRMVIAADRLTVSDVGTAADGSQAFGLSEPLTFLRAEPAVTANRTETGLVILTLVPPAADATRLAENGQVAVQYTEWLTDGTRVDSSRVPGRQPFLTHVPGGLIRGWHEGLKNIARGERRRLVVPPDLGFGARGARMVPPNSTLIFDIECLHVDNSAPAPAPPPANPHGMPPAGASVPPARPAPSTPAAPPAGEQPPR